MKDGEVVCEFQAVIQHLCSQKAKEGREMFWQGNPAEVLRRLGQLRLAYTLNPEEIALYQVILGAMEHFPEVGQMYYHLSFEKALDRLSMYFQELDRQGSFHIPAPTSEEIEHHIDACVTFFLAAHHV
jgi:TetR/AcrR family transcriptional regulator, mexJK operon transcriptional repressor